MVPDPNVQPNHGWRHTFKTIGLEAELPERVLDEPPAGLSESLWGGAKLAYPAFDR